MTKQKLLLAGTINNFCLETSYANAAIELGYEVARFDPASESGKFIKFGKLGRKFHAFLPIEAWVRKMNRNLVLVAKELKPDVILLFGTANILYGTLVTIKLIHPGCKFVWIWPDTPMNLNDNNLNNACLFDVSGTYSKNSVEAFTKLGFANTHWIALAGDKNLHWNEVRIEDEFEFDISFVGMWRPERERVMKIINENFGHLRIGIYGNYWQRNCADKNLLSRWKGNGFFAKDLADHFNRCRININVIDDTNYPAANMRFFEIPTSGGLELSSTCPEFENEFIDNEHILYFTNEAEIISKINQVIGDPQKAHEIRKSGNRLVKEKHNYTERLKTIMELLK